MAGNPRSLEIISEEPLQQERGESGSGIYNTGR
jgi:hypothetical protein